MSSMISRVAPLKILFLFFSFFFMLQVVVAQASMRGEWAYQEGQKRARGIQDLKRSQVSRNGSTSFRSEVLKEEGAWPNRIHSAWPSSCASRQSSSFSPQISKKAILFALLCMPVAVLSEQSRGMVSQKICTYDAGCKPLIQEASEPRVMAAVRAPAREETTSSVAAQIIQVTDFQHLVRMEIALENNRLEAKKECHTRMGDDLNGRAACLEKNMKVMDILGADLDEMKRRLQDKQRRGGISR